MTYISYKCIGNDDTTLETNSLAEARKFISIHGGSYVMTTKYERSDCEAYTKSRCRSIKTRT
jgi:hypothetical protein